MADYFLILLPLTYKVLLETSFSAGFWFAFVEYSIPIFNRTDEIVDIFSDEDFQNQSSSFSEEYVGDIEDGEIELDTSILIDSCLSRCMSGDI